MQAPFNLSSSQYQSHMGQTKLNGVWMLLKKLLLSFLDVYLMLKQ